MEQPDENCCNGDDPRVKTRFIDYDANGNQLEIKETIGDLEVSLRKNLWDEENRLTAVNLKPDSSTQHPIGVYTYDAGGERIIKRNLNRLKIRSNAKEVEDVEEDNMMLYPSGLVIAKPDLIDRKGTLLLSYTKHYYIGSERMATKIGTTKRLGLFPNEITSVVPNLNPQEIKDLSEVQLNKANTALQAVYGTFELQAPNLSLQQQDDATFYFPHEGDLEVFFFHPDHLGSSSYITNLDGNVTQHMEYLPFGETLVDEHTNSNNSPFKFNAKELDEETGNYYYGARYYDPKWSIWLSVDPLAEAFPEMSPYSYVYNNPLNYTDSTGMCPDGDCPEETYVGKVNELEDVYITNKPQGNKQWTSESTESYSGTMAQYQAENTEFAGMSNAETEYRYNERYNNGMDYHNWKLETEGQMRLGAFVNRFKFMAYDTGVLNYTKTYLEFAIGGESAPFVGRGVVNSASKVMKGVQNFKSLRMSNPNALNRTLPGFTDEVSGSMYRQGRGALQDFATQKPALMRLNSQKFSKYGQWGTGVGLSGAAGYYYYKKMMEK